MRTASARCGLLCGPAGDGGPAQRGDYGGGDEAITRTSAASGLQHIVANSTWSVVPTMTRRGPIEAWIIDGWPSSRRSADGCGVWEQRHPAPGHRSVGRPLRGCHSDDHQSAPGAQGRSEAAARQRRRLALSLLKRAWRTVVWRDGTNKKLRSRFARVTTHARRSKDRCSSQ